MINRSFIFLIFLCSCIVRQKKEVSMQLKTEQDKFSGFEGCCLEKLLSSGWTLDTCGINNFRYNIYCYLGHNFFEDKSKEEIEKFIGKGNLYEQDNDTTIALYQIYGRTVYNRKTKQTYCKDFVEDSSSMVLMLYYKNDTCFASSAPIRD